ncbi:hypothetical protein CANCADRAFT_1411 [Tortispora caseinolytica NRRL Y-17796]|uniref:Sidoreflexin n=1 Tax=Tortispora caseinolytica NRRL Y-17796 TaxID=767744 RepID=A0A1E4TM60_9ASCO|nr:hypothetical protein CANCADRAFT_1411 [Tortispora caseinolytica NRRL Y-17796]
MASSVPGIRPLPESQYDLKTYWGRVRHCAEVSDPRMLLVSKRQLDEAREIVSNYRNDKSIEATPQFWHAKKILDSTLHPDTGEPVLLPFRMSCFVLSNLVVTAGMLTPNLGTAGTLFWQVANQSLNVAVNTANANKSHPLTTQQLLTSYALAVSASCSVALGLNGIVPRLKNINPGTKVVLSRLVPFAAVASAGMLNVFLMRSEEIRRGISVYDADTEITPNTPSLGKSRTAAFHAVGETALSRVINSTPVMVIPPLILVRLQRTLLKGKGPLAVTCANLGLILTTSLVALPFALGVFPQIKTMPTSKLEPEFKDLKRADGSPITRVVFNRGI